MKRKIYFKRALKICSLALAVLLTTLLLQEFVLCHADHNRERINGFYLEDKDSLDVVFIGASETYSDFSSVYAYSKYNFTSYPIASQSNTVFNYIAGVKEAVRTQHPKLIVIEINGALYDDVILDNEVNLHNFADHIPATDNKKELLGEFGTDTSYEYYVPIIKYHSVWNEFPKSIKWDISIIQSKLRGYNLLKGIKSRCNRFSPSGRTYSCETLSSLKGEKLAPKADKYLRELLDYCKSNNVNVLFTRFPHIVDDKGLLRYKRSLTAREIIRSYGFDYIGYDDKTDSIGLDFNQDFYNYDHMNVFGQVKFTDYLGKYLTQNYIKGGSRLTASQKREWDECVRYYDSYCRVSAFIIRHDKSEEPKKMGENALCMARIERHLK